MSSRLDAPANTAGSAPPSSQNTSGAPAASASTPTSSLPVTGPGSNIRSAPTTAASAPRVRSTAAGSLTRAGADSSTSSRGSATAPDAWASARTMRSMAASTLARTSTSKVRTDSSSSASSGMMLPLLPAVSAPTVTTAISAPETSRAPTPCSRMTVAGALAGPGPLQPHGGGGTHQDGIDRALRAGAVAAGAVQRDPQRIGGGE